MSDAGRLMRAGAAIAVAAAVLAFALRGCGGADEDADAPSGHDTNAVPKRGPKTARPRATPSGPDGAESAPGSPASAGKSGIAMTVRVRLRDGTVAPGVRVRCKSPATGAVAVFANTGADGVARLADVPEGPLLVLWDGAASEWLRGFRFVERAQDLDVVLERLLHLAGTVTVPDGPASMGMVMIEVETAESAAPLAALPSQVSVKVRARSAGVFDFSVPAGRWFIRLRRGEFAADDGAAARFGPFDAGQTDIRIVVTDWPRIDARVEVPEGAQRCGWMWFERDGVEFPTPFVSSSDDGFRSPLLKSGVLYDVVARGDSPANGSFWAILRDVAPGTPSLVLESRPARTIRGRVVDAKGNPLAEQVTVRLALRPDAPPGAFDITAAPRQGEFAMENAPWFTVRLVAGGAGQNWWTPDPPTAPEGDHRVVTVVAEPTVSVRGRLQLEDGTPVRGGWIGTAGRLAMVQGDGTFNYGGCIPGRTVALEWLPTTEIRVAALPLGEVKAPGEGVVLTVRMP